MIVERDEFLHLHEAPSADRLWGDTYWISVVDREANVFGVIHFHFTNKRYARYETHFIIDGVQQFWADKRPVAENLGDGPYGDGRLTYAVVRPLEEIRITFDGPRYGFDITFTGGFPVFDHADCIGGDPVGRMSRQIGAQHYGKHYDQPMRCRGTFEIRGGPRKGERRQINCWGLRDHTWSARFDEQPPWEQKAEWRPLHHWASIHLPERHIQTIGSLPGFPGSPESGGFLGTKEGGSVAIRGVKPEVIFADDLRTALAFRYEVTLPEGDVIHVRTGRQYGSIKLWDRGENDLENRLDCYEPFFDFEVEETGERGYGVNEYSVHPPFPRWLV